MTHVRVATAARRSVFTMFPNVPTFLNINAIVMSYHTQRGLRAARPHHTAPAHACTCHSSLLPPRKLALTFHNIHPAFLHTPAVNYSTSFSARTYYPIHRSQPSPGGSCCRAYCADRLTYYVSCGADVGSGVGVGSGVDVDVGVDVVFWMSAVALTSSLTSSFFLDDGSGLGCGGPL